MYLILLRNHIIARNWQKVNVPFLKNKTEIFEPTENIWYTVPCIYKNRKSPYLIKKKTKPVFLVKWYLLQFIVLIELCSTDEVFNDID